MITDHRSFKLSGKVTFEKVTGCPPMRLEVNMPNEACFYYVLAGESETFTAKGIVRQAPEEGLVLQCGKYITQFLNRSEQGPFEAIAIHLYPEVLSVVYDEDFSQFLAEVEKVKPIQFEHLKASQLLRSYVENLMFYFENPELVSDELQKLKIKELLLLLARTDKVDDVKRLVSSLFSTQAYDFKSTVEANLFEDLGLEELAFLTGMSLSSFKRHFHRAYGQPPGRYIRQQRLSRAAQLLKNSNHRISEVAFDCGFKDQAHFSKTFLKVYGSTPTAYRKGIIS